MFDRTVGIARGCLLLGLVHALLCGAALAAPAAGAPAAAPAVDLSRLPTSTPAETAAACDRWEFPKAPGIVSVTRRAYAGHCVERLRVTSRKLRRELPVDVILPDVDPATVGRLPVLTLLGGMSLALQGADASVQYWTARVHLDRVLTTLDGTTMPAKLESGLQPEQRAGVAASLADAGRRVPMILVLPHTEPAPRSSTVHAYLATELVPIVDARYPTRAERRFRAIDGICLGGVMSIMTGLGYPELFGMVGGIQPAMEFKEFMSGSIARAAKSATPPHLEIITSTRDNYRKDIVGWVPWIQKEYPSTEFHEYVGPHAMEFYEHVGGPLVLLRYQRWFATGDPGPYW